MKRFLIFLLSVVLSACGKNAPLDPDTGGDDPEETVDATITVSSEKIGTSKFITGLSHVDYTLRGGGSANNAAAQAKGKELMAGAIGMNATHVHGFGIAALWPQPDAGWNWSTLDAQMEVFKETGGQKAIILYGFPWWMRGVLNADGTTRLLTSTDQFLTEGRILTSKMEAFDAYVDAIARRYLAAPHNVRVWVLGNELKGYYNRRDQQKNLWDSGVYPGTPGDHADHGYTYLWNRWAGVMRKAAIDIGLDPNELVLMGPYAAVRSEAVPSGATVELGHPLAGKPYGEFRKNAIETIDTFLKNADNPGGIAFDAGSGNAVGGETVDIFKRQQKWVDIMSYIRNHAGGAGTNLPVFVTETYLRTGDNETSGDAEQAAFKTVGTFELIRSGYTSAWLWSPIGLGEPNPPAGGLMTGTSTADGAQPKPWYDSLKAIHEQFAPGTDLYQVNISNSEVIDALANDTKVFLVNKKGQGQVVKVNGTEYDLIAFECKLVEWN